MATASEKSGRIGTLVSLIVVPSFFALPIFLIVFLVSGNGTRNAQRQSFDINASSIALVGVPGKIVAFNLTGKTMHTEGGFAGASLSDGLWASDSGLSLELYNNSGFDETFDLIGPVAQNWGDTLTCPGDCAADLTINMNFMLPSYLAESADRTLSGKLTGDITTPQPAPDATCNGTDNSGCGKFENTQKQLHIPVTLKLGTPNVSHSSVHEISKVGTLITLGVLVVWLGMAVVYMVFRAATRRK